MIAKSYPSIENTSIHCPLTIWNELKNLRAPLALIFAPFSHKRVNQNHVGFKGGMA